MTTVHNVDLNVKIEGEGQPFIWGHGLMGSMEAEAAAGIFDWASCSSVARCVRYDARGHGRSGGTQEPADYAWVNLAQDMLGLADTLGIDRFVAGGQSMGSATALSAALAAPQRVKGLVLLTPPTAFETRAAQAAIYNLLADVLEKKGVDTLIELARQRPLLPPWLKIDHEAAVEAHNKSIRSMDPAVLAAVLRGSGASNFPPPDTLKKLSMPVLILAWTDDATHPVSVAEELHGLLKGSKLVISRDSESVGNWPRLRNDFIAGLA